MTGAVLERPASLFDLADRRFGGSPVSLEERLNAAFHAARITGSTECPVCAAPMVAEAASGGTGAGAGCTACGATLT